MFASCRKSNSPVEISEISELPSWISSSIWIQIFLLLTKKFVTSHFIWQKKSNWTSNNVPLRYKKAGWFEKLLGFAMSHSIVTRSSVSLSCATTSPLPAFLNLNGILKNIGLNPELTAPPWTSHQRHLFQWHLEMKLPDWSHQLATHGS